MKTYRIIFFHVLAVVFFLSLFACAGPSKQQVSAETKVVPGVEKIQLASIDYIPMETPIKANYDNIIFRSFECNAQFKKDYPDAPMSCKESIILQLHSKNAYQNVTDDTNKNLSGKSILVDMKVIDMRIASDAAHFLIGDSFMDVLLELRDANTEEVVHQKVLSTSNKALGTAWSFGGSGRSLPSDFGTLIGEYIFRIAPGTK
jgi:hypothetical protein